MPPSAPRLARLEPAVQLVLDGPQRVKRQCSQISYGRHLILVLAFAPVLAMSSLDPFKQRVVHERVQNVHETVFVLPQQSKRHLAGDTEDTCDNLSGRLNRAYQSYNLPSTPVTPNTVTMLRVSWKGTISGTSNSWPCDRDETLQLLLEQQTHLFEQAVKVDMDDVTRHGIQEDILQMSVAEAVKRSEIIFLTAREKCSPQDVSNHGHDGCRPTERLAAG